MDVTTFLEDKNYAFNDGVELLRKLILDADKQLSENIKWNSPNYSFEEKDRITMRIHPTKKEIQIIFHCGAKVKIQPKERLIKDETGLLTWKTNDRAIANFSTINEIENHQLAFQKLCSEWINSTKDIS